LEINLLFANIHLKVRFHNQRFATKNKEIQKKHPTMPGIKPAKWDEILNIRKQ